MTTIILPNTITFIANAAFYNTNIKCIEMQEGIYSIGNAAFCRTQISSIHIPSVCNIGNGAFADMKKLTSILISSAYSFGTNIFDSDDLLRTIVYMGEVPPTNWVATTQTYVPNANYTKPKYSINDAHIYTGHDWVAAAFSMLNWDSNEYSFVYSGHTPEVVWSEKVDDYTPSFNTNSLPKDVGTWSVTIPVTFTKGGDSFIANCVYNYTITKALLNIKANDASRTYGEENPVFNCTYTGLMNNEDASVITSAPTISTTATSKSDVGTYAIKVSGGEAQNYSFTYEDGTLTVLPANLAVTVNDATREYGEENPAFALTYSGLKKEETEPAWTTAPTFTTEATAKSDVGTYAVDVTAEPKNYTIMSKQTGTLTITQAPLTLKADDATRPYYADDPEFTFTCEGFKNDDDASVLTVQPTFTPDAIKRSYVGTYDLNLEGAEAKNYAISYVPATLTITPRPLSVKVNDATRVYGEQNPKFELTYEGFVNNETYKVLTQIPIVSTAATVNSDAGTYDLYVSGGKATNYELSYQQGLLTVTQRPLTVSVSDYERDYGEENPTFELIYDNFGGNDDETSLVSKPVARTTATKTSDVGTYAINVTGGSSPNYTFTYVPGLLTINRAEQIFTWEQDLSDLRVGDQVELKAIASSGLPVTFTMADNDIVDVYQAGRKTYMECLKPGTVVIKAQQEGNKNYYPTQRITKTIVVNVATSVDASEESALRIRLTAFGIRILNAEGETARIYTPDGVLVKAVKVAGAQMDVDLPEGGIYLVKVADKTVKVSR
ncbi:MAG: leucine-rich repeat protein [Bacteroidaceae bacterium]|nr:leucine-rich repeat protein [Bacteroidaceae bacterium]